MHEQKYLKNDDVLISSCLQSEMMKRKFLLSKKNFLKSTILKIKILFFFYLQDLNIIRKIIKNYIKIYVNL